MKEYIITYHKTKNNLITANIKIRGESWFIHSKCNPISEAKKLIANIPKEANIILVLGYGLGYIVNELQKKKEIDIIVIAEYIEEFRKRIPNGGKLTTISKFIKTINRVIFIPINRIYIVEHKPSIRVNPNFYEKKKEIFIKAISEILEDVITRIEFEKLWVVNSIRNIPYILYSKSAKELMKIMKGRITTAIIVSAGPSLIYSIKDIKKELGKVLIVSTDTAYPVLLRHSIIPDFVFSIDSQIHSKKHFYIVAERGFLIADVVANPSVLRSFIGRTFLSATMNLYSQNI